MLSAKWKQRLAVLGVALTLTGAVTALTGGAVGLVEAQSQVAPTPDEPATQAHTGRHHGNAGAAAAQAIGITVQELHQELPGKSLTQVAEAHGKSAADVAAALKTAAHARIDQRIDQAMTRVVPADAGQSR